jgi:hypothetical protein
MSGLINNPTIMNTPLADLPVVSQLRELGSVHTPPSKKVLHSRILKGNRQDLHYIRDADEDNVYFVIYGGGPPSDNAFVGGKIIKIGDKIIFNGTDDYGFDMGTISHIGKDDFQIEYFEFINSSALRKCRNLNRLPVPDDFSKQPIYLPVNDWNVGTSGNARKLTMKFKKFNETEERTWFVVIHSLNEDEYKDEYEDEDEDDYEDEDGYEDEDEDDYEDEDEDEDDYEDEDEGALIFTNYHCGKCRGGTPMCRERCRRLCDNSALTAYTLAAYDAANGEGEYTNNTITTWGITIEGNNYMIDYNNVLFSLDGEVLGYAKPSNIEGLDELFEPVFFDDVDRPQSPAPPEYTE